MTSTQHVVTVFHIGMQLPVDARHSQHQALSHTTQCMYVFIIGTHVLDHTNILDVITSSQHITYHHIQSAQMITSTIQV